MSTDKSQQRAELLRTVRDALQRAEFYCARTRHWDTRLLIISIICGAMADSLFDCCTLNGIRHRCWRSAQKLSDYDPSFKRGEVRRTT